MEYSNEGRKTKVIVSPFFTYLYAMKKLPLLFILLIFNSFSTDLFPQNPHAHLVKNSFPKDLAGLRSDTIDILHYTINLSVTDFKTDTLRGNTVITYTPKMNTINTLSLDLEHFTVDSVLLNNNQLYFTYNDTLLILVLSSTENKGDTNA